MTVKAKKAIIWSTVGTVGTAAVVLPIVLTQVLSNFTSQTSDRELRSRTFGAIMEEIVPGSEKKRTPNTQVYETEYKETLMHKYGKYGFRYPAYNFRYDASTNGKPNDTLTYEENGVSKTLKCREAIHKEEKFSYVSETLGPSVTNDPYHPDYHDDPNTRYSWEGFIWDEMKRGTLKKHPAINHMYRDMITDDTPSITKRFVMPPTIFGTNETGLYVPPGEIAEITFGDEMYEWIQEHQQIPISIKLNNNAWDGKEDENKYPMGGRYPFIKTEFKSWGRLMKNFPEDPANPKKRIIPRTIKFGSPFGGIINIFTWQKMTKKLNGIEKPINYKFEISGAIPTFHYVDGFTTEGEWNQMIKDVYDKKRAPFFTANTFFYSFGFPFESNDKELDKVLISGKDLKTFPYPAKTFRKWFDFLFNSWYFDAGDRNPHRKIDMEFSDAGDIWGGAAAWGGGDALYSPTNWGVFAFLSDVRDWSWAGNWGNYHEINHNFEGVQNRSYFKVHEHGETNMVSLAGLTQLNDTLRARTELDPLAGQKDWQRLSNHYGLMNELLFAKPYPWGAIEYGFYANMIYTFGPYNFMDYAREDVMTHWNNSNTWNGQQEVIRMSDYWKLNLVDPIYDYRNHPTLWTTLKTDLHDPNSEEKSEFDRIRNEYKRIDFVGNLYAAGSWVYDHDKQDYYYGGDSSAAYTIPFGYNHEFNMQEYTMSIKEIPWGGIELPKQTANGMKIQQNANDPYKFKILQNPSLMKEKGLEDEFDVALIVEQNYAKKYNTVPKYKWKIKVRYETNTPTIEFFEPYSKRNFEKSLELIDSYDKNPETSELKFIKKSPYLTIELGEFLNNRGDFKDTELSRIKFKYVVPETRNYMIQYWCDDQIRMKINNDTSNEKFTFQHPSYIGSYKYVTEEDQKTDKVFKWKKGDIIDFDIVGINVNGAGGYGIQLQNIDPETGNKFNVDFTKNALVSEIFDINNKYFGLKNVADFLTDIKYAYEWRKLDYSRLPFITGRFLDVGGYGIPYANVDNYNWYFEENGKINKIPGLKDDGWWERWGPFNEKPMTLYLEFNNPQDIGGIVVSHRTNNHYDERPTKVKVTDLTSPSNPNILYDGEYAKEFNDRSWDKSILNFTKTANSAKQLKVELWNTKGSHGLSLKNIKPFNQRFYNFKISNSFDCEDPRILYSGKWEVKNNDMEKYQSNMNNTYIKSGSWTQNEMRFNVFGNGFTIVGPLVKDGGAVIDIFVNGELVKADFSTQAEEFDPNASIYTQVTKTDKPESFEVKIVVKSGSFIFNYLNTYGDYSNLYLNKKGK